MDCANPITHIIRRGDTLYKIAKQYNTSVQTLLADNEHLSVYNLTIGEPILVCPNHDTTYIQDAVPRMPGMQNQTRVEREKTIEVKPLGELMMRLPTAVNPEITKSQAGVASNIEPSIWSMPAQVDLPKPGITDAAIMQKDGSQKKGDFSPEAVKLIKKMRELWMEYIIWTRMAVMGEGSEEGVEAEKRLMRNPSDMARLFKAYYGATSAGVLEKLMIEHIGLFEQFAKTLYKQAYNEIDERTSSLKENTKQIAGYLAQINPYYDEPMLLDSFNDLLDYIMRFDAFSVTKQYSEDVAAFDEIEKLAMGIADYLSDGIIKQFYL